jgi:hypothetical protein
MRNASDAIAAGDLESAELIAKTINQAAEERNEFEETLCEIDALENSSQEYNVSDELAAGSAGKTSRDDPCKAVKIEFSSTTDISLIAHEFKHAYQFESGTASFGALEGEIGRGNLLLDLTDEFEGYKRQALFNRTLLPSALDKGITISNISQIESSSGIKIYGNIPAAQQRSLPVIDDPGARDKAYKIISNTFKQAFRANGKTYYPGVQ